MNSDYIQKSIDLVNDNCTYEQERFYPTCESAVEGEPAAIYQWTVRNAAQAGVAFTN